MDQNGDGFLTAEEVLRYQRATTKATVTPSVGSPGTAGSSTTPGNGNSSGGRGQGDDGKRKGG